MPPKSILKKAGPPMTERNGKTVNQRHLDVALHHANILEQRKAGVVLEFADALPDFVGGVQLADAGGAGLAPRLDEPRPRHLGEELPDVEATGSVPAEGMRKVRVIYTATDRYIAPESATVAVLP